jgi:hypothetical protein
MGAWLCCHAPETRAQDVLPPFALESTQVLPAGNGTVRYLNLLAPQSQRFTGGGGTEPLGYQLNRTVSWNDVINSQTNEVEKKLIQSVLHDQGLSPNGSPGYATGNASAFVNVKAPVLGFGITERLTAAVVVPIETIDVNVATGFVRSADGQKFIDGICQTSPDQCNDAADKLNSATQQKLQQLGYWPLTPRSYSGIGDVQLITKYLAFKDAVQTVGLKFSATLPTGATADPNDAMNIALGDGRLKTGLTLVYDRELVKQSRWTAFGGYTFLFPKSQARRIPASGTDNLSADTEVVNQAYTDFATVGTSIDYRISRLGLTLTGLYSFTYQGKSHYYGGSPALKSRLVFLENLEPAQAIHAGTLALGFSTVEWYLHKDFFLPFQLNVVYSVPFAGMNAPTGGVLAGEFAAFF